MRWWRQADGLLAPSNFFNPKIESTIPITNLTIDWKCLLLQSWTLYKSADCRWMSITILCVSFTNSATVGSLEQVQLCNPRIDQSADNVTGLKCAKEPLILKYISISRIPEINLNCTCYINQDVDQRNVQNDSSLCCRIYNHNEADIHQINLNCTFYINHAVEQTKYTNSRANVL